MTSYISWDYRCPQCDHIETHLQDRKSVPDTEPCSQEGCSGVATRMYGGFVSTSKLSASIPDATSSRFSKIREQQKAKRALSMAKQTGDKVTEKIARKELNNIKRIKS